MALPSLIEIVPLKERVTATITVPGSKSITNRALILAALAHGETILRGALWSEDTQVMVECLRELGYMVTVAPDPAEPCNRTITVYGKGASVPAGGTEDQPLELFVGNAGTAARFLSAFVCLGKGVYRIHGVPRMHERPQAGLFQALRSLGYRIDSPNDKLPAIIHGAGARPGKCSVSIEQSSQFASALLLGAGTGGWQVSVVGDDSEEASYVAMTMKMIEVFPKSGGVLQIEPDASSGSYFMALRRLGLPCAQGLEHSEQFGKKVQTSYLSTVTVANWPHSGWQIDERFPQVLARMDGELDSVAIGSPDAQTDRSGFKNYQASVVNSECISRAKNLGDSIMTAIVVAPLVSRDPVDKPIRFTELGRLRLQECERVVALRTELTKCGAKVIESGETLEVYSTELHGAEIETYNDHRMAMCFAILGLKVSGIKINNPACVKKTFPDFFQKLAAPPPHGLGATIQDGHTGRSLALAELFAD
ncbi:MAG TPA: 3-phosphoshikimate 1-carboxyvinyltransferase [Verrucomicrobiae bacterium]|nr:3-phosphoshikimate 1-carboxyvinyltransferase [Verrucomicrobiae bacterium]